MQRRSLFAGATVAAVHDATAIDPWFLAERIARHGQQMLIRDAPSSIACMRLSPRAPASPTRSLATLVGVTEAVVRASSVSRGRAAGHQIVDSCAAEFEAKPCTTIRPAAIPEIRGGPADGNAAVLIRGTQPPSVRGSNSTTPACTRP